MQPTVTTKQTAALTPLKIAVWGFATHRGEAAAHHRKRGFSPPAVQQPQPKPTQLPPDTHPPPRVAPTLLTYKQPTTDYRPGTYRRNKPEALENHARKASDHAAITTDLQSG